MVLLKGQQKRCANHYSRNIVQTFKSVFDGRDMLMRACEWRFLLLCHHLKQILPLWLTHALLCSVLMVSMKWLESQ